MVAITLSDTKIVLDTVTTVLAALPIPDPFKSAVSAIPSLALSIVEMAEVWYIPITVYESSLLIVSNHLILGR
jgi:hypothetical protein